MTIVGRGSRFRDVSTSGSHPLRLPAGFCARLVCVARAEGEHASGGCCEFSTPGSVPDEPGIWSQSTGTCRTPMACRCARRRSTCFRLPLLSSTRSVTRSCALMTKSCDCGGRYAPQRIRRFLFLHTEPRRLPGLLKWLPGKGLSDNAGK